MKIWVDLRLGKGEEKVDKRGGYDIHQSFGLTWKNRDPVEL